MPSVTTWTRIESKSRSENLRSGLQARFHDPLWSLARQWQIGEFEGEDAASPVAVRLRTDVSALTRIHLGALPASSIEGDAYDGKTVPLETLVERETIQRVVGTAQPDRHHRYESGLHFLRLLEHMRVGQYRGDYIDRYALLPPAGDELLDADSQRFIDALGPRVPDGVRLYEDLRNAFPVDGPGTLPGLPRIEAGDIANVTQAATLWLEWFDTLYSEPQQSDAAWLAEHMEYAFAVAAPGREDEHVLVAPEYAGGHLDWYAFNRSPGASLGAQGDSPPETHTQVVIPAPVNFRGMPAARWWEFEDAQVDFGAIDAGPDDLLRMLMINFALDYGNDWFVLPYEQPVGTITRIRSLVVTDSFGGRTLVEPYSRVDAPSTDWRMYCASTGEPAATPATDEGFLLAPVLANSLHSDPLEEVLLLRDEMSNMAWAVERLVEGQAGTIINRYELYQELEAARDDDSASPPAAQVDGLKYVLTTQVPDYWTPLLPVREAPDDPSIRLHRGRLLRGDKELRAPVPLGRILEPNRELRLFEEEVPRAGARVTRAYQRARWIDGSTHVWIGRQKSAGRGEGFSGLRFDLLERSR